MARVVLVTGVSGDLGSRFARLAAADPAVDRVVGVDVVPPRGDMGEVRFVRADIRNPVIAKVIAREDVDTVVHASVFAAPGRGSARTSMKELNVIGSMQLLAACQKAPGLKHLVVNSSTSVYGSSSRDPAMFTEDMAPKRMPRSGFAKDICEVEGYVRGFARRRPDVTVTTLRGAPTLGPHIGSPLAQYFTLPVVPTVFGFDARMQFLHETDLLEALRHATVHSVHGTFNLAGDGVITLSQVLRRLGKVGVPMPPSAMSSLGMFIRQVRVADINPEQITFLTYGRGVDTSRMRDVLGFHPDYTTESAFAEFVRTVPRGALSTRGLATVDGLPSSALAGEHG